MIKKVPYNISKGTIEIYRFRAVDAPYWADVTIDSTPGAKAGRISIASDFGSWNYFWGACGSPFKQFLAGCDQHYVANKFGADKFFDAAATIAAYRETAKDFYNKKSESYKNLMMQITELESNYSHKEEFIIFLNSQNANWIRNMYDGCPEICNRLDPGFENFWGHIWPLLLDEFKKERETVPISIPDGVGDWKDTGLKA